MKERFSAFHNNYEQVLTILIFNWTIRYLKQVLVNNLKKVVIKSLKNPTKYITEFIERSKKGHHITYQKRIFEAEQSG